MRWWISICVVALLTGCGGSENAGSSSKPKRLKAAICPTSPPNSFQRDGVYVGLDVDVFKAFCADRGYDFEMTAFDWAGMLGSVVARRADVAFSGISITEKRREIMDLSEAYMTNRLIIAAMDDSDVAIDSPADWRKYRLGFVRGMYFGDLIKTTYRDEYAYDELKQYPSYNELLADLGNRKIDGAFMDSMVMADQAEKGVYALKTAFTLAEDDKYGFAFPKNSGLCVEFNQYLESHRDEVQAIIDRYLKK